MITLEKLTAYGANVDEGIARCMGQEDFYLKLVETMLTDGNYAKFEDAVSRCDVRSAFTAAHSLKGSLGNLELTPLAVPMREMTERLRNASEMPDLSDLMPEYRKALAGFRALDE